MKPLPLAPVFLFLAVALSAHCGEDGKPAPEVKEEVLRVERADLQVLVEADGTLDVAKRQKLKVVPEEFPGPYTLLEIRESGEKVESGGVLARLETAPLERLIRGALEGLDAAKVKLQTTRDDLETLKTTNRLKLERAGLDLKQAERDLKSFGKYGEEQLLQGKELALKQQEHWQANREQELAQLEKMYKDAQLASETKEIVLERARREVALGREGLVLQRKSEKQLKEFDHPSQQEKLSRALEQKQQDLELLRTSLRLAESLKSEELKAAERAVRDGQERLARLDRDLAQMTLKAPFAGVLRHGGLEAGDKANPHAAFADLLDLTRFEARFLLTLKELQVVHKGDALKVRVPDLPDLELDGKVEDVSLTVWPEGQDKGPPRYLVRAKVDDNTQLKHGARVRVEIRGEKLKRVIALPRNLTFVEEGRAFCKLRTEKGVEKRELTLGLGDRDRLHVVRGLAEGETVIVKEGKK